MYDMRAFEESEFGFHASRLPYYRLPGTRQPPSTIHHKNTRTPVQRTAMISNMRNMCYCAYPFLILLHASSTSGFSSTFPTRSFQSSMLQIVHPPITSLFMVSFGNQNQQKSELPKDVKEAISKCRAATQEALGSRISRMDIEMPVGTKFGVEKQPSKKKKKALLGGDGVDDNAPTKENLDTSDRELARLFVDMFQPLGGEHISVMFNDGDLADIARGKWKDSGEACRIASLGKAKRESVQRGMGGPKKKKKKPQGFAAKMNAEVGNDPSKLSGPFQLPENTEVALFVAPGPKELITVEKICSEVGMDTLVILLNARLDKITNFGTETAEELFMEQFESVFQLKAAPQEEAPGCLLYRAYPTEWIMARKPKAGQPKPIISQQDRPTAESCRLAYNNIEIGDMEKNVENVLENVAGWFS